MSKVLCCFVVFCSHQKNLTEKFIITTGMCSLSCGICGPYQVHDLRGRTPNPKAAAFAALAGEAGPQNEVFDSPIFALTGQNTECRITELPNQNYRTNHRMVEVVRDLWTSPSPNSLLNQVCLELMAQPGDSRISLVNLSTALTPSRGGFSTHWDQPNRQEACSEINCHSNPRKFLIHIKVLT